MKDSERPKGAKPDPRRAYRAGETPAELAELLIAELDRLIEGAHEADGETSCHRRDR
jgi:hypothetical protein